MLSPDESSALLLSIQVALAAVAITAIPGVLLGLMLARWSFPGKALLDAVVHLPLVLPPVVVGYLLLLLLGSNGVLGKWLHETLGLRIAFTFWAAVLASGVVGFPLLVRAVRLGVELVDRRLEQAARTLGAGPMRVMMTVTVPLALPGILTGAVLMFARSLGEFGATITFAGNIEDRTRTIPLALYNFVQMDGRETAAMRLAVLSIALSLAALLLSEILARRVSRRLGDADARG
jgi:molybdate transport system permease protein